MSLPGVNTLSPLQSARRAVLGIAFVVAVAAFAVIASWTQRPIAHEAIEILGLTAILGCIAGRCWCTLYIGGRKGAMLVDSGPYSLCRNPLYSFSILGAAGFGAQTGSLVVGLATALVTWGVFRFVVSREERFLEKALGSAFTEYRRSTPRFLPDPRLWKTNAVVEVMPRRVLATFFDGLLFLLAIPLAEGLEHLQALGAIPVLMRLP